MRKHEAKMVEYMSLVKVIAKKMIQRLPSNIELDDLISAGCMGLIQALEKYDEKKGKNFKTYAEFRVRGAIIDELRAQDWAPKAMRQKAKAFQKACEKIQQRTGKKASTVDLEKELSLSKKKLEKLATNVHTLEQMNAAGYAQSKTLGDDQLIEQVVCPESTPFDNVYQLSIRNEIKDAVSCLAPKEGEVIRLYYFEELNLREIGQRMNVSESRVCQLHSQGIVNLKTVLEETKESA